MLVTISRTSLAQSGAARLRGSVAFENVAYVDKQPTAKVVLRHDPPESEIVYSTETDERWIFQLPAHQPWPIQAGDYMQRISTLFGRRLCAF
jgi:hypothetical protein